MKTQHHMKKIQFALVKRATSTSSLHFAQSAKVSALVAIFNISSALIHISEWHMLEAGLNHLCFIKGAFKVNYH